MGHILLFEIDAKDGHRKVLDSGLCQESIQNSPQKNKIENTVYLCFSFFKKKKKVELNHRKNDKIWPLFRSM